MNGIPLLSDLLNPRLGKKYEKIVDSMTSSEVDTTPG